MFVLPDGLDSKESFFHAIAATMALGPAALTATARATTTQFTFASVMTPLMSLAFGGQAEETTLWQKPGVPSCNPNT